MSKDKKFERKYSLNVARMNNGKQEESFSIDHSFFEHFELSQVKEGALSFRLDIDKYNTHLDVRFHLTGTAILACDRCMDSYEQPLDSEYRIIYAFDEDMRFEGYEVMYVNSLEAYLPLAQEFYDFINISIPVRRVPPKEVHLCSAEVLNMLGLDEEGNPLPDQVDEETIDPRWAALKKLKKSDN